MFFIFFHSCPATPIFIVGTEKKQNKENILNNNNKKTHTKIPTPDDVIDVNCVIQAIK